MKFLENQTLSLGVLIIFSALIFIVGLGAMPLTDPDEVFYAETAKEMIHHDTLLTPYIFGKPQFEKPPLYYWSVIAGFKIFGVNEFGARIPSAIFAIFGIIGIYLLGKLLVNKRTGFFAGIALATGLQYLVLARGCVTDILLGVLILYAFLFFFYGYTNERGKNIYYLISAGFLGLAVLTKGPVGILLPFTIIAIYLILTRDIKRVKEIPLIKGTLLFFAIALPWYILMYKAHGNAFIDGFFGFHNIIRFLEPEHKIGDVFYYYAPVLALGLFPWTLFLPLGIWQMAREKISKIRKANIFFVTWIIVFFAFFSLSRTKLPTYIFPLYPAIALIIGRLMESFMEEGGATRRMKNAMLTTFVVFFASLVGIQMTLYFITKLKYPTVTNAALLTGAAFTLFMGISALTLYRKKYTEAIFAYMLSFVILVFPLSYIILPEMGKYEASKEISEHLQKFAKPGDKIGAETDYTRGIAFYTDREDVPDIHPHHLMTGFLEQKEKVWAVIKEKNHIFLYTNPAHPFKTPTYLVYRLGKKVIVTNKIMPGEKYIKMRTENDPY